MHDGTKNNILLISKALHDSPISYNNSQTLSIGNASTYENNVKQWAKNEVDLDGLDVHVWFIMDTIFMYCAEVAISTGLLHEMESTNTYNAKTWPRANQLFNRSSIVICSAIDLLGHLMSIVLRETPDISNGIAQKREWNSASYDFYTHKSNNTQNPRTEYANNHTLVKNEGTKLIIFRSSIESVEYSRCISDTIHLLRHKPIHNHYNYIVARHPLDSIAHDEYLSKSDFKWSLFDPSFSIREVMEQRKIVKGSNFNPLETAYFFPRHESFIVKATDILDSLLCYSIETFRSIVKLV